MNNASRLWIIAGLALIAGPACRSKPGVMPAGEVLANGSGSIEKSSIRARLLAGDVELSFPLQKNGGGRLQGSLSARLLDVSAFPEVTLASGSTSIEQSEPNAVHVLALHGLPIDFDRRRAGPVVIEWSFHLPQGLLYGPRSLYAALDKLEVEIRGVTDVPEQGAPLRIIARDPDSGAPKVGASVQGSLDSIPSAGAGRVTVFQGLTDQRGELAVTLLLPGGVESGVLHVDVQAAELLAGTETPVLAVRGRRISLSTDKTIYKPGQTIELRSLALDPSSRSPLASHDVVFEALDGKGNKVFKRHATTDQYGVAAVHVVTDAQVNEGTWTLRATVDSATTEKKIPVARYILPKMKVSVSCDKDFALAGDTVTGRVDARYLFGRPVANARVDLSLTIQDATVGGATLMTDASGSVLYSLAVPHFLGVSPSDLEDGKLAVAIQAMVTDTANQVESGGASIPLAAGPLVIRAIQEAPVIIPGVDNVVDLAVTDPVGRPIAASLKIDGIGPFAPLTTDASGVAELRFVPAADAGQISLDITATDGANRIKKRTFALGAASDRALMVRADRAIYHAGDSATLQIVSSSPANRIYIDLYQGAIGAGSTEIDAAGSRSAMVALPISSAMKGLIRVEAFFLAGAGDIVRGTTHVWVDPGDRLDIALESDADTYAPGAGAQVRVTVKDASGRPQVASLGLSAVDEAVFVLGGEPDGDLRTLFDGDPIALPSDLRVLGLSAADLLSSSAPDDRAARLLFASAKDVSAGFEYNSLRAELPEVRASLVGKVERDAVVVIKALSPFLKGDAFTMENVARLVVPGMKDVLDPFGNAYGASLDPAIWQSLVVHSNGPDEIANTADDVSATLDLSWVAWGDPSSIDENGQPRPVDAAFASEDASAGGDAATADASVSPSTGGTPPAPAPAGVRSDFRETVYVNPTLITDPSGTATVSFPLAQSITTWRITAEGSTLDGKLGSAKKGVRTFQSFFIDFDMPLSFTQNDVVEISTVVYNYLPTAQPVTVTVDPGDWLDVLSLPTASVMLAPSEVRAVKFSIRARVAGTHALWIHGAAGSASDALVRTAYVTPDGVVDGQSRSGRLSSTKTETISIPSDAIPGGTTVSLTLTPGFGGIAVQGVEALLKEPNGCFEQTTSSAWPNTMVTNYLQATGQLTPDLKEKAFGLVTRGYQRLLTFESPTGGFNWWGDNTPGNRILSAIMLWHLKDMEGIVETDDAMRARTLSWLLDQQRADGSWASGDELHTGDEILGTSDIRTTAFIAWALAHTGWAGQAVQSALTYLSANLPPAGDVYANALSANAFAAMSSVDPSLAFLFSRLDAAKQSDPSGGIKWTIDRPSWTGAAGDVGALETTSLIAYGLMKAQAYPNSAEAALRFILANKDSAGSWYNTQATMNALRALLAAASPSGSDAEGSLSLTLNGQSLAPIPITRDQGDVYRRIDLTPSILAGDNHVLLRFQGTGALTYQLARRAYRPRQATPPAGPFLLSIAYDTASPSVGQPDLIHVTATYSGSGIRDQVMVRVGRAPGFAPDTDELDQIVASGRAARYEVRDQDVSFYLMGLMSGEARDLSFHVTPSFGIQGRAPASSMYAYYDSSLRADVGPVTVNVQDP
jgi:hypothetical protein